MPTGYLNEAPQPAMWFSLVDFSSPLGSPWNDLLKLNLGSLILNLAWFDRLALLVERLNIRVQKPFSNLLSKASLAIRKKITQIG